ncbi:putative ubiquinone biosynthesis monooxygenase, partial [Linderina macrospora]
MTCLNAARFAFAARALKRAQTRLSARGLATAATPSASASAEQLPVERYDIVIVGGGPSGCTLASALGSAKALGHMRIALVDSGKLSETRSWEPPADTFLNRTLQITASNKRYLEKVGSWNACHTERVQPYDRVVALDGSGSGKIELNTPSGEVSAAYMIETKNLVSGMLKFIDTQGANIDVFEKAKVTGIARETGPVDWPVVTLGNKHRLQARLLVGTDGGNSSVR